MRLAGTLAAGEYTKKTVDMALARKDFCIGFISTSRICQVHVRERERERESERERGYAEFIYTYEEREEGRRGREM